ncbi:hypothetical protein ACWCXB_04565 [Streptomyces sp. NPDC001514]
MKVEQRTRRPLTLLAILGLLVVTVAAAYGVVIGARAVWYGTPYPSADPKTVAERLRERSQWTYDGFGLNEPNAVQHSGISTGACYYRGLQSFAHIDEARLDVSSFEHSWEVAEIPEADARAAQKRLRQQLSARGWKLTHDGDRAGNTFVELGFRFEDPESSDMIDVRWNDSTTTLFVSVYAQCSRVPDEVRGAVEGPDGWHPAGRDL